MRALGIAVLITLVASSGVDAAARKGRPAATDGTDVRSRYTRAYNNCPGFKHGVTPDMLDCISAEYDIQDKRLNTAFAAAMRALSPTGKENLREAQRAWIAYRDAWCGIDYDGGQAGHVASNECMLDETIRQTIKLEELARYAAAS